MSITFSVLPPHLDISFVKDKARKKSKSENIPLHAALDAVCRESFEMPWNDLQGSYLATLGDDDTLRMRSGDDHVFLTFSGFSKGLSDLHQIPKDLPVDIFTSVEMAIADGFERPVIWVDIRKDPEAESQFFYILDEDRLAVIRDPDAPLREKTGAILALFLDRIFEALDVLPPTDPRELDPSDLAENLEDLRGMIDEAEDDIIKATDSFGIDGGMIAARIGVMSNPFCSQAYLTLSKEKGLRFDERMTLLTFGLHAAEIEYGAPIPTANGRDNAWHDLPLRPWLRMRRAIGETLAEAGKIDEAILVFEDLAARSPHDTEVLPARLGGLYARSQTPRTLH